MMIVVGLSHRTAPVQVRERLAAGADALPSVLARLASRRELSEAMFLSTCNRVEVLALVDTPSGIEGARQAIREELARQGGAASGDELVPYLYEKLGDEAVRHVFRVAASLDSMVLGEPQIFGQVKEAYEAAVAAGTLKGMLGRCLTHAFTAAKRVRTETDIGAGSVSISSVAADLATRIFGDLTDRTVLLLGAGEMAEAAAKSLVKGARALRICNRSFERAATLAGEMHAAAVPWDGLAEELTVADVVVASTASTTYVVTRQMVQRAMKERKGRTLLFVDIAVPRNVDPTAHGIDNAYVFNVDDLEHEVARGLEARVLPDQPDGCEANRRRGRRVRGKALRVPDHAALRGRAQHRRFAQEDSRGGARGLGRFISRGASRGRCRHGSYRAAREVRRVRRARSGH